MMFLHLAKNGSFCQIHRYRRAVLQFAETMPRVTEAPAGVRVS